MAGPCRRFTVLVLKISNGFRSHFPTVGMVVLALAIALRIMPWRPARRAVSLPLQTDPARCWRDLPKGGALTICKNIGTLLGSGVPILQALTIVKETAGNVIVGGVISKIHDSVKEGGNIAGQLKESRIFPGMVSGMVDVGEQSGALPDMLMKIADTCDEEVDNAVSAMTSLLEPVMIIFLAIVVGSIVIPCSCR